MTGAWRRLNYTSGWAEVVIRAEWEETCDRWPSTLPQLTALFLHLPDSLSACLTATQRPQPGEIDSKWDHCYNLTITVFLFSSLSLTFSPSSFPVSSCLTGLNDTKQLSGHELTSHKQNKKWHCSSKHYSQRMWTRFSYVFTEQK